MTYVFGMPRILDGFLNSQDLEILTTPSVKVTEFGPELVALVGGMKIACEAETDGAGISAVQIGVLQRIFVIRLLPFCKVSKPIKKLFDKDGWLVCVNPKFTTTSNQNAVSVEGCLSFAGSFGKVRRYPRIKATFQDLQGEFHTCGLEGFLAFVFQHELDHLDGKSFVTQVYDWLKQYPLPSPKKIELISQAEQRG
jgi:peptide deformylase